VARSVLRVDLNILSKRSKFLVLVQFNSLCDFHKLKYFL